MNLPQKFKEYAAEALTEQVSQLLFSKIDSSESITSVRTSPIKMGEVSSANGVLWCNNGYYLQERPVFTLDPAFHCGAYYVQEASSMYMQIVKNAIKEQEADFWEQAIMALDLCAAPGGKSTHLLQLLGNESILVSNEVIKSRCTILADNIAKWGYSNCIVTNNDPADFHKLKHRFNLIVVDAPCSGEGMFRKDSDAINEWSQENVKLCAARSQRILSDIWDSLVPGGFLVFSTCTYNKYENDDNLLFLQQELGAQIIPVPTDKDWGIITTPKGGLQFVPGLVKGEGQYMAIVRKSKDEEILSGRGKEKRKDKKGGTGHFEKGCPFVPKGYVGEVMGELVKAYPEHLYTPIKEIEQHLKVVLSGVAVATKKGKDYIPYADLALQNFVSEQIQNNTLPKELVPVEVDIKEALKFLAKEQLLFPDKPKGYLLLTYKGNGLGFVKNLGNRSNNLHPMARRIRMDITSNL